MKLLANLIQLSVILAIILPIAYFWETDKVDKFCQKIRPGMTQQASLALVDQYNLKLAEVVGKEVAGVKWHAVVKTHLPLVDYQCRIEGVAKLVIIAGIIKSTTQLKAGLDRD